MIKQLNRNNKIQENNSVSEKLSEIPVSVSSFKTKIKLPKNQEKHDAIVKYLEQSFGVARKTYNILLAKKKQEYDEYLKAQKNDTETETFKDNNGVKKTSLKKWFNQEKLKPEYFYITQVSKCVANEKVNDFNKTLNQFYKRLKTNTKIGFPKFKKKGINESFRIDNENFALFHNNNKTYIELAKLTERIELCEDLSQLFDYKNTKLLSITVSKQHNDYYVSINFCFDAKYIVKSKQLQLKKQHQKIQSVGIDLGITDFATIVDSDGFKEKYFSLKTQKDLLQKMKFYQSKFSKTKKTSTVLQNGSKISVWSKNKTKWHGKLRKLQIRIKNIKQDYLHKLSTELCLKYAEIKLEDLNVIGMLKNHNLARVIQESCFNQFKSMLTYKAIKFDTKLILVDRFFPSSKICFNCKTKNQSLKLKHRTWVCSGCQNKHDRDYNAANNILHYNSV